MSFSFSSLPLAQPEEILHDLSPVMLIHKNGRIERLALEETIPPSTDHPTGVRSKDVQISSKTGLSARLYLPTTNTSQKHNLPLVIYFHGGGFVVGRASGTLFQPFLNRLAFEANVVVVSVDYRRAPEHPLPTAYDDSWDAIKWVVSHAAGNGRDPWLTDFVDFKRVFFGGESSGANIAHQMAMRIGLENDDQQVKLSGIVLIHPYFWGDTLIGGEVVADVKERDLMGNIWRVANPDTTGLDDPMINPGSDANLWKLGCKRVLVTVAEKDLLRDRGWYYHEVLEKSGWNGNIEIIEAKAEGHAFHLFTPFCENALTLFKTLSLFFNEIDQ
ncbi:hypothetical protein OSB04_013010 [Centaurea solstitialis]|uniref:Alpha/beta hydrolase fold-3 domain-containing protein n=1 Tax=Centaurea solstitialis TaxID=347529 RepID=A0AA38WR06_9ASTR|nr:hypothetical protein OSB04_013010 [Centaurea solstitialis]